MKQHSTSRYLLHEHSDGQAEQNAAYERGRGNQTASVLLARRIHCAGHTQSLALHRGNRPDDHKLMRTKEWPQ